ncbi:ClpP/crotonase-like domain-containing protein [Umbelopsis sp. PMI_123]|nr:ClpP/crotonase-like domain-containing protein [Umbelopsis sp. PMI_123]
MTLKLPQVEYCILSIPEPHILLVTINRPKQFNALHLEANQELARVFDWAEDNQEIWCSVITGAGSKAFCAGMDLKSANQAQKTSSPGKKTSISGGEMPASGFGGLSKRNQARKPVIAAVNGFALGGGTEIVLACDIVVATQKSIFGLPEVKRGVIAAMGGIARVVRIVGYQRACEMALTGRHLSAQEAKDFGFVNDVISNDQDVVAAGLNWAKQITANSPDAVFTTKRGLLLALERESLTRAADELMDTEEAANWVIGQNLAEGLQAFVEKRRPNWTNPQPVGKSKL